MTVACRATAAGRMLKQGAREGWEVDRDANRLMYADKRTPGHYVCIDAEDGEDLDVLWRRTQGMRAGDVFLMNNIASQLAPVCSTGHADHKGCWFDLAELAKSTGHYPRGTEEKERVARHIWDVIQLLSRQTIKGERSVKYVDKNTGERIDTYIESPLFHIGEREMPKTGAASTPIAVELIPSRQLARQLSHPSLAQYIPRCEVLGRIPRGKVAGAWAASVGIAIYLEFRKHPLEALAEGVVMKRSDLFSVVPEIEPPGEILKTKTPSRVIEYLQRAFQILIGEDIVRAAGDAVADRRTQLTGLPSKNWARPWLDQDITIYPGETLMADLQNAAKNMYVQGPRQLGRVKSRRGRPPKGAAIC